jgi:hypothetical protein
MNYLHLNKGCKELQAAPPKIVVQCVPDAVYYGLMALLITDISKRWNVKADLLIVRSVSASFGFSIFSEIKRSAMVCYLYMWQWLRLYGALWDRVAYWSSCWRHPFSDLLSLFKAYRTWKEWEGKESVLHELIEGVRVGDLVIDTYLRFKPSPSFDVHDKLIWRILWQVYRDVFRSTKYFRETKPLAYFTSYSTYVEHGIAVRVALKEGARVYAFGNFTKFGMELTTKHTTHAPSCENYKENFQSLSIEERYKYIAEADVRLKQRLNGVIDSATAYMKRSAYSKNDELTGVVEASFDGAVIFLHDFYDSPHVWEEMIFDDFWEWLTLTINRLDELNISYYIKPHPNQIKLSDHAIHMIKNKYPHVRWLNDEVNNKKLVEAGLRFGVTVFGSIAHELAYLGVPSICAAKHAHSSFSFCMTAKTKAEYLQFLGDMRLTCFDKKELNEQAKQFYTMHNNLPSRIERDLCAAYLNYWMVASVEGNESKVVESLNALRNSEGYVKFINGLSFSDKRIVPEDGS